MATFREIVYMCLDLLKETVDDAFYTEEHVLFLAGKMRALLLERKYRNTRNSSFNEMSDENKQQICLTVEPATLPGSCGNWLRSTQEIPALSSVSDSVMCAGHDMLDCVVTFVPMERIRYVGYNKWLKNIVYAAKSEDGHLYLKGSNPQFMMLERVGLTGVFSDIEKAAALSHDACAGSGKCDIMDQEFPLEASLVPSCIELVVQELSGARFVPGDRNNNASDDMGNAGHNYPRSAQPAEDSTYKPHERKEEE